MSEKINSLLYWKWEEDTITNHFVERIDDMCERAGMDTIFVGLHWIERRLCDPEMIKALRFCADRLHAKNRRLVAEVCPRNEGAAFYECYPDEGRAYLTTSTEVLLDENGAASVFIAAESIPHYWRMADGLPMKVIAAFLLQSCENYRFEGAAVRGDSFAELVPENGGVVLQVSAGSDFSGYTAVVFAGHPQTIPDLASPRLSEFYRSQLEQMAAAGLDGVMSDEWGYDVAFRVEERPDTPEKSELYFEHITWSAELARGYAGDMTDDLLYMFYTKNGEESRSLRAVNSYHRVLRAVMRQNDEDMYAITKEILGQDAFYGVHPTWWGSSYLQNFEGFKNGFYWWEAKRDVAQTDEMVLTCIRTALSHKWGSPVCYNMWYSMGTRDINTYYRETWNNIRFGGRTHYLGYECPNESVVLELKPEGLLESIESMDRLVRRLDNVQKTAPDCRVLVVFGIQNALNWAYGEGFAPPWYPRHEVLYPVLECADKLFDKFLCDLVPTSEIENGSLTIEGGRARYGTQSYDAVVLLAPDSMAKSVFPFFSALDKERLFVCGEARIYDDACELSHDDAAVLDGTVKLPPYDTDGIAAALDALGVPRNRFENGCVLQDGSMLFAAEGKLATGNPLSVHVKHNGYSVDFEGEDFLYLGFGKEGYHPLYAAGECIVKENV